MSTDRAVALLAACERADLAAVENLGWHPVLDALGLWPGRLRPGELPPYASRLGDQHPEQVAAAIRRLARTLEWRPGAAQVYQELHPPGREVPAAGARARHARPDATIGAYTAVAQALARFEEVCDCLPRSPQWDIDPLGVLRCPDCSGLEPGQVDSALEELDG